MTDTTIRLGKNEPNVLDIERLHNVHEQTEKSGSSIGAERRAGVTTYNFDSCLRLAEIGEPIRIFFITLELGMEGAVRYRIMFLRFLHEYGSYHISVNPIRNTINFLNCEVLFTSYDKYKRLSVGTSDHYVIYDI